VPPIDDAKDIIPNAVDRLLLNQWVMILVIGPYITPHETYERQQLEAIIGGENSSTDTNAESLTKQKLPVLVAFRN